MEVKAIAVPAPMLGSTATIVDSNWKKQSWSPTAETKRPFKHCKKCYSSMLTFFGNGASKALSMLVVRQRLGLFFFLVL